MTDPLFASGADIKFQVGMAFDRYCQGFLSLFSQQSLALRWGNNNYYGIIRNTN
jgi:hypothetical protein